MFKIAFVVFRECLEIALLIGVIMAVTKQIEQSRIYTIIGILLGIVAASFFAFFARAISVSFGGMGDEMFNSAVILLTVALISWTIIWMQGYVVKVKQDLDDLSIKINKGNASNIMLVLLVATTILREGTEIIILVYGISLVDTIDSNSYVQGFIIGTISGLMLGIIIYLGLIKLPSRHIFKISSIFLMFIAAGFAAEAAGILTSSGIITVLSDQLWDSSWLVSDRSIYGRFLNIAIGYIARPNGLQVVFYVVTISLISILVKIRIKCVNYGKAAIG